MLKIVEQTPTRLVLRDQRYMLRILALLFTVMSAFSATMLIILGYQRFTTDPNVNFLENRVAALLMFIIMTIAFTTVGLFTLFNVSHGVTVTLDKGSETVTIQRAKALSPITVSYAIYAVSRLEVEKNDEVDLYGIFLVLRSGERIALAALPQHEEERVEAMIQAVRTFLRSN
jgi:membrane glycosyltransferase